MRILLVGSVSNRLHQGPVQWAGHSFEASAHAFDRVVTFNIDRPCEKAVVDRSEMSAFLERVKGFDAIYCESPEALILAHEWKKQNARPVPLLALEVHGLVRVLAMREWYLADEGRDPWPYVSTVPWIAWLAASSVQKGRLVEAGVDPGQIHWVRGTSGVYSLLLPGADALFDGGPEADGAAADGLPEDTVVVPGSGRRDPQCYLRAAQALPDIPFAIVDQRSRELRQRLAGTGLIDLPNVQWLDPLALESYIALLRRARLVVVALQAGTADGGHTTVSMAHRLKAPVICSDVPGIADYVEAEVTARLVAPGDPEDLAGAIRSLWDDKKTRRRMTKDAHRAELSRARESQNNFKSALAAASAGLEKADR